MSDFVLVVQLAQREITEAKYGGKRWRDFVAQCEVRLGQPWSQIREDFDRIHNAGLTGLPR